VEVGEVARALVEFGDPLDGLAGAALLDRLCVRTTALFAAQDAVVHVPRAAVPVLQGASRPGGGPLGWREELAAGPVAAAVATGQPVLSADLGADRRWPALRRLDGAAGLALHSVPLAVRDEQLGVLTVLRADPSWTGDECDALGSLAAVTAARMAAERALDEALALTRQLQQALDSRVVIEQAKGIVAARDSLDMPRAFDVLRRYSRTRGRKIHDVARDIVEGRLQLG